MFLTNKSEISASKVHRRILIVLLCPTKRRSHGFDTKCQTEKAPTYLLRQGKCLSEAKNYPNIHASRCPRHLLSRTNVFNGRIWDKEYWRFRQIVISFSLVPACADRAERSAGGNLAAGGRLWVAPHLRDSWQAALQAHVLPGSLNVVH